MRTVKVWADAWCVWALLAAGWCWRWAYVRWPEMRPAVFVAGLLTLFSGVWLVARWRNARFGRVAPVPATPPPAADVVAEALDRVWCAAVDAGTSPGTRDEAKREQYRRAVLAAAARTILGQQAPR